jgi:GTPase SAR1 family protein
MTWISVLSLLVGALTAGVTAGFTWALLARRLPASYRIAVVGFPKSGKTTLITAVFAYLFRKGIRGASIVPRGEETIKRINQNMEQLELGRPIGPTKDQDVFAYRAEIKTGSNLFRRHYKLEIGDFPGEDTLEFAESSGEWLHESRYFEWAISSDAFIFVVDVGAVLLDKNGEYVARQKRALRAAWQRLQEHHLDSKRDIARMPLIFVFTKADLLLEDDDDLEQLAFGKMHPTTKYLMRPGKIDSETSKVIDRFSELIDYFQREDHRFEVVFASVFLNVEGERLGIPTIARYVMPRPTLWPTFTSDSKNEYAGAKARFSVHSENEPS